jgi:hypothetical protein
MIQQVQTARLAKENCNNNNFMIVQEDLNEIEAQLLKIIEEQQQQRATTAEEQALQLIQQQSTIRELESYTKTLNEKHSEAVKIVQKYQQIVQSLSEPTISADFSRLFKTT